MKICTFLVVVLSVLVFDAEARTFFDKLFSGFDTSYGYGSYGNSYGEYYPSRPRSYGRSYDNAEGGGERYKAICRIHAIDSVGFPGRIGRPVCP